LTAYLFVAFLQSPKKLALRLVEPPVQAPGLQQFLMCAMFLFSSLLQHKNLINHAHIRESVSDDQRGATLTQCLESMQDLLLGEGI
jgi:hypothetical protein